MICVQIKVAGSDVSLFAKKGFFDWKRKTLIADVELELQCVIADLVKIRGSWWIYVSQASSATGIARAMKTYELANPHYSHCSHCTVNSVHTANILFTLHTTLCSYSCPFYTLFRPDTALDIIPMLRHFTLHTVCTFIQFALGTLHTVFTFVQAEHFAHKALWRQAIAPKHPKRWLLQFSQRPIYISSSSAQCTMTTLNPLN